MKGITTKKTLALNKQIISLYKEGIAKHIIAKQLHVAIKYVREILISNGFTNTSAWKQRIDEKLVIKILKETRSVKETSKITKFPSSSITRIIKENHLEYLIHKQFNINIFQNIDTSEKAYWLGFIYADGYVDKYGLSIALSEKDKAHLYKFSQFMQCYEDYIYEKITKNRDKEYKSYRIDLYNSTLALDLKNLGLYSNKSLTITFPNETILPKQYIYDFIRGYFDGDGCIMTSETSKHKLQISIIGSKPFIESLKNFIPNGSIIKRKTKSAENIYYFNIKIVSSIWLCNKMYANAKIYLDRKKELWDNYCRSYSKELELLRGKFGENWDVNPEVSKYLNYIYHRNA